MGECMFIPGDKHAITNIDNYVYTSNWVYMSLVCTSTISARRSSCRNIACLTIYRAVICDVRCAIIIILYPLYVCSYNTRTLVFYTFITVTWRCPLVGSQCILSPKYFNHFNILTAYNKQYNCVPTRSTNVTMANSMHHPCNRLARFS